MALAVILAGVSVFVPGGKSFADEGAREISVRRPVSNGFDLKLTSPNFGASVGVETSYSKQTVSGDWFSPRGPMYGSVDIETSTVRRLCTAPCEVVVPRGVYWFSLSLPDGSQQLAEPILIENHGTLALEYHSRLVYRVAGGILAVAGAVAGVLLSIQTEPGACSETTGRCHTERPYQTLGLVVGLSSVAIGVPTYYLAKDSVETRFVRRPRPD